MHTYCIVSGNLYSMIKFSCSNLHLFPVYPSPFPTDRLGHLLWVESGGAVCVCVRVCVCVGGWNQGVLCVCVCVGVGGWNQGMLCGCGCGCGIRGCCVCVCVCV